jgi:2'-5' RNA ligase
VRLFVAINLPETEKRRLAAAVGELAAHELPVRWADTDSLHITLKFLGEVAESVRPAVASALRTAVLERRVFQLTLSDLGAFPSMSRPNIFWVGSTQPSELAELVGAIETQFERIGFAREGRAYTPHITIGRVKKDAVIKDRAVMDRLPGQFRYKAEVSVRTVDLMRSHLGPRGARYEVLEKMELN